MRLIRHDDWLELRDQSGMYRALGGFFLAIGATFAYGGLGGFANHDQVPWYANALAAALGTIAMTAGLAVALGVPSARLRLDRVRREFVVRTQRGLRRERHHFRAAEIAALVLEEAIDGDGHATIRAHLRLTDGSRLDLGPPESTPVADAAAMLGELARAGGVPLQLPPMRAG